jgi:acetyltransferase-like isoleucine patch superfamily enzyme
MKILKIIINKITTFINTPKPSLFYTKDIFKDSKFEIGDYTYGRPTVLFDSQEANLIIGKFCSIADGVTIFLGGNHRTDWITTYPFNVLSTYFPEGKGIKGHPATKGDVTIGNDVWIGLNVTIMSGVSIGDGAVIAACSVVSKNIGDYEIWGGNPSRLLKKRFDDHTIKELQDLKWWNWEISIIRQNLPNLCSDNLNFFKP